MPTDGGGPPQLSRVPAHYGGRDHLHHRGDHRRNHPRPSTDLISRFERPQVVLGSGTQVLIHLMDGCLVTAFHGRRQVGDVTSFEFDSVTSRAVV